MNQAPQFGASNADTVTAESLHDIAVSLRLLLLALAEMYQVNGFDLKRD